MASVRPKLALIDAHALIHRAFHAIPFLSTKNGELTNAVFGFTSSVLTVLTDLQPEYVAVSFDLPEPTFRHEAYKEYKATRQKAPDELRSQFGRVKEVVQALGMPIFEVSGYEADDVIGSLAKQASRDHGVDAYIVTGDRDSLQLVDDNIYIHMLKWRPGGRETITYDPARLKADTGLTAEEYLEYKALVGDTSDNIPGVPGIGEKTATTLVSKYKSLEGVYEALKEDAGKHPDLKPRVRTNLTEYRDQAFLSRDLSRIVTDIKLEFDLAACTTSDFDQAAAEKLFGELEFSSLVPRMHSIGHGGNSAASEEVIPAKPPRDWADKHYHLIATEKDFAKFLGELKKQDIFAFDTETAQLDSISQNLIGLSFSWQRNEGYYVACDHASGPNLGVGPVLEKLRPILTNPKVFKIAHNLKYDYEVLRAYDLEVAGLTFDTMLGSYLLNPGARTLKLDVLAQQELGYQMQPITELIGTGKDQTSLQDASSEEVANYAAEDADVTWQLYEKLEQSLRDAGLDHLMIDLEVPLVPVLAAMEQRGAKLDTAFLKKMSRRFVEELATLETDIWKLAGSEFNINSPAQLAKVLFEDLQLGKGVTKRGGKHMSTAAAQLERFREAHPIIPELIRYRELAKLHSTYIEALPKMVRKDTGRIHTSYRQTIAATGRLSSNDPNLQNIPIRTDLGREIRKAFVTEPGYVMLSADYSQFELRIAAHISGDTKLAEKFREGLDIHSATAAEVAGVALEDVKPEQRYAAKAVNFSILYGATSHGLAKSTGMTHQEAQAYIDRYFQTYPKLREYMDAMITKAQTDGYVETLFGRRRYLPEINASAFPVREAAKRMAINMPIQGTQADILKVAMINIHRELPEISKAARLILTVHDELVLEVPKPELKKVAGFVCQTMEEAYELSVPVVAEAKAGANWGEMTAIAR